METDDPRTCREKNPDAHGRMVAITRPMNARSVRTSPGMNTLTAWSWTCSGKKYSPVCGCGLVRQ